MKKPLGQQVLIIVALMVPLSFLTLLSDPQLVTSNDYQIANVILSGKIPVSTNARSVVPVNQTQNRDISGQRIIGLTISDYHQGKGLEKEKSGNHHEDSKLTIFIDNKEYPLEIDNIATEFKPGIYNVVGSLDAKTGVVTLKSARFVGDVADRTVARGNTLSKNLDKRVAVFLVDYKDTATQPFYPWHINQMMFGDGKFARYFKEASYSKQSITGDVFGWFTIPTNSGTGICQTDPTTDLAPLIANSPINLNNYGNIVIITLCNGYVANGSSNTAPVPYVINGTTYNKTATWVNISASMWDQISNQMIESANGPHMLTNLEHLLIHEFGHALGLHHAHGLSCEGVLPTNNCENIAAGNKFDVMSYETIGLHLSAWAKANLGWFTDSELKTITQSGIYTIASLSSQPSQLSTSNTAKAYRIKPSVNSPKTPIWIEFRSANGFDGGINTPALGGIQGGGGEVPPHNVSDNQNGIFIYKEGFENMYGGQLNPKTARLMYLRGAPNLSNENPYQVSLNPGETYTEPRYGLTITTLPTTPPTSSARRFQVTMNPNLPCTPLSPKFFPTSPASQTVNAGGALSIWTRIENMDYIPCGNSNFSVSLGNVPNGVIPANFNQINQSGFLSGLAPDDERTFGLSIYFGPSVQPGQYTIPIVATNNASGLSTTLTLPITIQ